MSVQQSVAHDEGVGPLRPLTRQMLQAASVFGCTFDIRCVALVLQRTVAELLPSVHEALAAGVLVENGVQLGFRDDAAREEAYYALPDPVRRMLHREAADALLSIGSTLEAAALVANGQNLGHGTVVPLRQVSRAEVGRQSRGAEDGHPVGDRPTFGWASLTDAELRVARLAASGLTNRLIADELSLSRHTVESHLRHAFRKLDIRSRVELTRAVLAHEPAADR
ncbi:MAG TPA: LuxR C-terminal-related transcriptional regulator [Kribbella sp.]|jgi:DNA-binding CsgD family transcriptional regulator